MVTDLPAELVKMDRQIFAQLDAFHWPVEYLQQFEEIASVIATQPELMEQWSELVQVLVQVVALPTDSPLINDLADRSYESFYGLLQRFEQSGETSEHSSNLPIRHVFEQLLAESAQEHFPAQIHRLLHRMKMQYEARMNANSN